MVQAVCTRAIYLVNGSGHTEGSVEHTICAYELDVHADRARRFDAAPIDQTEQPSSGEPPIDITSVTVHGLPDGSLLSDSSARIDVHYVTGQELRDLNVAVFLRRTDGLAACMIRSRLDQFSVHLPKGHGVLSVEVRPLQLTTGSYFAEVELLDGTDAALLVNRKFRSNWFQVVGRTRNYDPAFSSVFEPNARWSGPHVERPLS